MTNSERFDQLMAMALDGDGDAADDLFREFGFVFSVNVYGPGHE
jgi:hypothetical protein